MASSIDATKPTAGAALTADVRNNFSAAKTEIEALQTAVAAAGDFKSDGSVAMTGAISTAVGTFASSVANGASAVGFDFDTPSYTTAGAVLARWKNNATTKAWITKDGALTAPFAAVSTIAVNGTSTGSNIVGFSLNSQVAWGLQLASSLLIQWSTNSTLYSTRDVGLGRNAAGIVEVNNATAGTFRDLKLRNLLAGGGNGSYVQTPSMTVANLASAATAGAGARAFVTDATATTFLSTVAGGGANKVPVVSDGTNWLIG